MASSSAPLFVHLRVTGPQDIIRQKVLESVRCNLNGTWLDFLKNDCKLKVEAVSPLVIRTATRNKILGWEAKLGDLVKDFIKKFTYARKHYSVRLVKTSRSSSKRPSAAGLPKLVPLVQKKKTTAETSCSAVKTTANTETKSTQKIKPILPQTPIRISLSPVPDAITPSPPTPRRRRRPPTPILSDSNRPQVNNPVSLIAPSQKRIISRRYSGYHLPLTSQQHRQECPLNLRANNIAENNGTRNKISLAPPSCTFRWPEDRFQINDSSSEGDDKKDNQNESARTDHADADDALSQFTSASMEEHELERDGIPNKEIKPRVIQRLAQHFDNATMLRIQKELKHLVQHGSWHRVTARAPRTGHLLQDIFQIFSADP